MGVADVPQRVVPRLLAGRLAIHSIARRPGGAAGGGDPVSDVLVAANPQLEGRVIDRLEVCAGLETKMFRLLAAHFAGVDRATFREDLDRKSAVILLEDETRALRGFSTLQIYTSTAAERPV